MHCWLEVGEVMSVDLREASYQLTPSLSPFHKLQGRMCHPVPIMCHDVISKGATAYDGCYSLLSVLQHTMVLQLSRAATAYDGCYSIRWVLQHTIGVAAYNGCYSIRLVLQHTIVLQLLMAATAYDGCYSILWVLQHSMLNFQLWKNIEQLTICYLRTIGNCLLYM